MSDHSHQQNVVVPAVCIAQGDGTYLIRTGRPIARLSPLQFGREIGASRRSVYRYIDEGLIPSEYIHYVSPRRILISAAAVPAVLAAFRKAREV